VSARDLYGRRRAAFAPAVDVFYEGDPPRAVVHVELPGVNPDDVTVEVLGRELLLTGVRRAPQAERRLYQQIEIEHGAFRRVIPLGADVDATQTSASYRDGILVITLPLVQEERRSRRVPIAEQQRS
jgi:HSP20 family protein